jgi:hypothetical protein
MNGSVSLDEVSLDELGHATDRSVREPCGDPCRHGRWSGRSCGGIVNARTTAYEEIRRIGARLRANGALR